MPKSKNSGNGEKPTPLPRTKTQEDYTPKAAPRKSQSNNLDYKIPSPSQAQSSTQPYWQPSSSCL